MDLNNLFEDDSAVSPVIGVILMVAITVILAAVIGTFVLGQADQLNESAPSVQFEYDGTPGNSYDIIHAGGDDFTAANVDVSYGGTTDDWQTQDSSGTKSAGASMTTSGTAASGDTIRVLWASAEGGTSSEIGSYEVPT